MDWVTIAAVADQLGVPEEDDRLADVVAAADAYVKRQRPDLDPDVMPDPGVYLAGLLYASFLFRLRTSPGGLPGYDDAGQYDAGDLMANVYRLLGNRRPVAR